MKECAWCGNYFEPATSYQIYCNAECRKLATKQKIKERSRAAVIKRRSKNKRFCSNGCGTSLSIYNDSRICSGCATNDKIVNKTLNSLKDFFDIEDLR